MLTLESEREIFGDLLETEEWISQGLNCPLLSTPFWPLNCFALVICHMIQLLLQGLTMWHLLKRPPFCPQPSSTLHNEPTRCYMPTGLFWRPERTRELQPWNWTPNRTLLRVQNKQTATLHRGSPHVSCLEDRFPFPSQKQEPLC